MNRSRNRRISSFSGFGFEALEGRRLLSALGQDVQHLATDLKAIHAGSSVTSGQVSAVVADFQAIAKVATKPSASSVATLQAEIKLVTAQGSITPAESVVLKKDVEAVLASANVPASLASQTATDIKTLITATGITRADVKEIGGDLKAILTDLSALRR